MTLSDETLIRDRGSDLFQDAVFEHECLDAYFRGFISATELVDRINYLKGRAEERAVAEFDQHKTYSNDPAFLAPDEDEHATNLGVA